MQVYELQLKTQVALINMLVILDFLGLKTQHSNHSGWAIGLHCSGHAPCCFIEIFPPLLPTKFKTSGSENLGPEILWVGHGLFPFDLKALQV